MRIIQKQREIFQEIGINRHYDKLIDWQKIYFVCIINIISTAINIFLKQAIREKGIPFYINSLPENSELAQAFEEAKQIKKNPSNYKSYSSPEEMFKDVLGEDYEG